MTNDADIAALLDRERTRVAREARETPEQHDRRLAMRAWKRNLSSVWMRAHLLTDDELIWLAGLKPGDKGTSALRLAVLSKALFERHWAEDRRKWETQQRAVCERLHRLGLPAPRYYTS